MMHAVCKVMSEKLHWALCWQVAPGKLNPLDFYSTESEARKECNEANDSTEAEARFESGGFGFYTVVKCK